MEQKKIQNILFFHCNVTRFTITQNSQKYRKKSRVKRFTIDRKSPCFFFFPRGKKREIRISNKLREREPEYRFMEYACVNHSRYERNTRRIICLPYREQFRRRSISWRSRGGGEMKRSQYSPTINPWRLFMRPAFSNRVL